MCYIEKMCHLCGRIWGQAHPLAPTAADLARREAPRAGELWEGCGHINSPHCFAVKCEEEVEHHWFKCASG